jgi:putative transcriptional regulator
MREPYQYTESGLDYIYLINGVQLRKTPYGEVVSIEDVDGLHAAIVSNLVEKPSPLTAAEFRFIRQFLGLSQKRLGELFDVSDQTIAKWEKDETPLPRNADVDARNLAREKMGGNAAVTGILELLAEVDRNEYLRARLEFVVKNKRWQPRKAA